MIAASSAQPAAIYGLLRKSIFAGNTDETMNGWVICKHNQIFRQQTQQKSKFKSIDWHRNEKKKRTHNKVAIVPPYLASA